MLKMILKELERGKKEERKQREREEKARQNWIAQINKTVVQPTLKPQPTKQQTELLIKFLRKVTVR